jgi:peptidoglycan/xylan/chitin deacetylase (PgdA/CDA1 family)
MRFARRPSLWKRLLLAPVARTRSAGLRPVLLTFDDGPHPEHTPAVLARLAAHGTAAAFFLVGERVAAAPHLPAAIAAAGHLLGNHTFTHGRLRGADDVARCQAVLPGAAWFRPPFGRLTVGQWRAARRHGLRVLHWSLDSNDWRCRSEADARQCAAEVLRLVRPGDVILFHDDRPLTGPILDVVLPGLSERGLLAAQYTSTISSPPCSGLPMTRWFFGPTTQSIDSSGIWPIRTGEWSGIS